MFSSSGGGVQEADAARIRCGWEKFKDIASVLCNRALSLKPRGNMYKSCVKSALCYVAECWALRKDERKLQTTEVRMLRIMYKKKKTLRDGLSNQIIHDMTNAEKMEEFMREQRLRWFGLVERMDDERSPVKAKSIVVDGSKKGRPKKRWKEVVEKDMLVAGFIRTDVQDRFL